MKSCLPWWTNRLVLSATACVQIWVAQLIRKLTVNCMLEVRFTIGHGFGVCTAWCKGLCVFVTKAVEFGLHDEVGFSNRSEMDPSSRPSLRYIHYPFQTTASPSASLFASSSPYLPFPYLIPIHFSHLPAFILLPLLLVFFLYSSYPPAIPQFFLTFSSYFISSFSYFSSHFSFPYT